MKIKGAVFFRSVYKNEDLPKSNLPEIAFSGKSNVGKSSLINTILNIKGIAKTSSTPGRTQSLNFILVNDSIFFVDLPGYGYAKVPASVKRNWGNLIESYLKSSSSLSLIFLICDARRNPGEEEIVFVEWLEEKRIPFMVVLTKIDKLKRNMRQKSINLWRNGLGTDNLSVFSAVTGEGKDKIRQAITLHLKQE